MKPRKLVLPSKTEELVLLCTQGFFFFFSNLSNRWIDNDPQKE
jgi:hypothetical protein